MKLNLETVGARDSLYFSRRLSGVSIRRIGLPDAFCEHASRVEQLKDCGLDPEGIAAAAREFLAQRIPQPVK